MIQLLLHCLFPQTLCGESEWELCAVCLDLNLYTSSSLYGFLFRNRSGKYGQKYLSEGISHLVAMVSETKGSRGVFIILRIIEASLLILALLFHYFVILNLTVCWAQSLEMCQSLDVGRNCFFLGTSRDPLSFFPVPSLYAAKWTSILLSQRNPKFELAVPNKGKWKVETWWGYLGSACPVLLIVSAWVCDFMLTQTYSNSVTSYYHKVIELLIPTGYL